ncbi:hypothetical protein ACIOVC_05625 [Pseudomonas neuropathica]
MMVHLMIASGRKLLLATGRFLPILLKKSVLPDFPILSAENVFFARRYVKSEPNPTFKRKISISSVYFSVVETMADFFNRICQKRTLSID